MENLETVLVTGGTGSVDVHCILQLLQKGYSVKTTPRSLRKASDKKKQRFQNCCSNLLFIKKAVSKIRDSPKITLLI